jgi:maltose O-acetyltransferase
VTIGANTVVGAGAVVTRDLAPNVLAVGVPARVTRRLAP